MSKKFLAAAAGAVMIFIIVVVVALLPSKDICSDDVRGYESTATSSLDATRKNLSKINTTVSVQESRNVPTQLEGLTATSFAALKACDTQCKLLGRCLRFVFMTPPSEACPNEYADYKARTESALGLLKELQRIEEASANAAKKAEDLADTQKDIAELEKSSGSTGGRVAVLKSQALQLQNNLSMNLSLIDQKIENILPK